MSSNQGWIKLHRALLDWQWFSDANTSHVLMYCLLKANHKDNKYRDTIVKRGTFLTGRELISRETGCSVREVRTALKRLESANVLTSKTSRQGTVIEVLNYDRYQQSDQQSDQRATNKRPTSDQQTPSNKNEKNEENEKNTLSDEASPAENGVLELIGEKIETSPTIEEEAERVWKAYPRDNKRADSIKKIKLALKDHSADFLIDKINAYALTVDDPRFYAHATTWFNGRRYEEDFAPPKPKHNF